MTTSYTPRISAEAEAYRECMGGGLDAGLVATDPEFVERFENFAFDEVIAQGSGADGSGAVVSACLPYIGYPRSLNALRCIDEAAERA